MKLMVEDISNAKKMYTYFAIVKADIELFLEMQTNDFMSVKQK